MSRKLLFIFCLLGISFLSFAQEDPCASSIVYYSFEEGKGSPDQVESLDLAMQHPKLTTVPAEVANFPNLKCLDVSFNRVSSIHPDIVKCEKLEKINLAGNRYLTGLPEVLIELKNLKIVDVSGIPEWTAEKKKKAQEMLPAVKVITD